MDTSCYCGVLHHVWINCKNNTQKNVQCVYCLRFLESNVHFWRKYSMDTWCWTALWFLEILALARKEGYEDYWFYHCMIYCKLAKYQVQNRIFLGHIQQKMNKSLMISTKLRIHLFCWILVSNDKPNKDIYLVIIINSLGLHKVRLFLVLNCFFIK